MKLIAPERASHLAAAEDAFILDVRTPAEFRAVHARGASLLPLDQVKRGEKPELSSDAQAVLVLCKSGKRAEFAANALGSTLKNPIHVVEGGTDAWVASGLPHEKGKGVIGLDRQVRIAAGGIVVLGVLLSALVHPAGIWLSGFVGAGLVFAGITDTCGMALLLAKMPWNKSRA